MSGLAARNPAVQHLRRLSGRRRARLDTGCYVIEGPTLLADALADGVRIDAVYLDEAAGAEVEALAGRAAAQGARSYVLRAGVLDGATDAVTSQGVAALAARPACRLEELPDEGEPFVLVLDGIADPGNVGTVLRSAEASGAAGVVVGPGSADPFGPKTVRASAGAVFRVPVVETGDLPEALRALAARGWHLFGTVAHGGTSLDDADLSGRIAIVLGNESRGLAADVVRGLHGLLTIPMQGRTESLNVAMAATLLAFEVARRRRTGA